MKDSERINLYRNRFRNSLIGKWTSAEGTFQMMEDEFNFSEDGKGTWISTSGSGEETIHFEWREKAPFTIEMREVGEGNWMEINYDFKIMENDLCKEVILCQKDSNRFYLAITRVSYSRKLNN